MALQTYVGDTVKGRVDVLNSSSSAFTADVLWAYGTGTSLENFSFRGPLLFDNYNLPAGTTTQITSATIATPNDPGTWSVIGIIAQSITVGATINITRLYDVEIKVNEWIISAIPISIPTGGVYVVRVL